MPNKREIQPPAPGTYAPYYESYIQKISGKNPLSFLESQVLDFKALLSEIPDELEGFAYAPGKWTIKEVVAHVIDTERIMAYRALCIARGEIVSLPGFDENEYVRHSEANHRSLYDLGHEFGAVREATISLYKSLSDEALDRQGVANNNPVTARAILYIIAGHQMHHENVIRERYVPDL